MTSYSAEQIARVCHAANSELQVIGGDPCPSLPWDAETRETRRSAVAGVEAALRGATPEQLHEEWARGKAAAGWRRGLLKDPQARTHPSLVPYAELPEGERVKDAVFAAIVRAMAGGGGDPEARLSRAREVIGNFLGEYGDSEIPMFKVAQDLANSLLKVLSADGRAEVPDA